MIDLYKKPTILWCKKKYIYYTKYSNRQLTKLRIRWYSSNRTTYKRFNRTCFAISRQFRWPICNEAGLCLKKTFNRFSYIGEEQPLRRWCVSARLKLVSFFCNNFILLFLFIFDLLFDTKHAHNRVKL